MTRSEDDARAITYRELVRYFDHVGRSVKCAACGQDDKGWKFHADQPGEGPITPGPGEPLMSTFRIPLSRRGNEPIDDMHLPALIIECPTCANMEFISAIAVEQFLIDLDKESGDA